MHFNNPAEHLSAINRAIRRAITARFRVEQLGEEGRRAHPPKSADSEAKESLLRVIAAVKQLDCGGRTDLYFLELATNPNDTPPAHGAICFDGILQCLEMVLRHCAEEKEQVMAAAQVRGDPEKKPPSVQPTPHAGQPTQAPLSKPKGEHPAGHNEVAGGWSRAMSKVELATRLRLKKRAFETFARGRLRQVGSRQLWQIRLDGLDSKSIQELEKP